MKETKEKKRTNVTTRAKNIFYFALGSIFVCSGEASALTTTGNSVSTMIASGNVLVKAVFGFALSIGALTGLFYVISAAKHANMISKQQTNSGQSQLSVGSVVIEFLVGIGLIFVSVLIAYFASSFFGAGATSVKVGQEDGSF